MSDSVNSYSYFKEIARLFGQYRAFCGAQDADYASRRESGDFSKKFLNDLYEKNIEDRRKEQRTIARRIDQIRDLFIGDLDRRYDLSAEAPSGDLVGLLNSGIALTQAEYLKLATKFRDSVVNSRLIHDRAAAAGYELRNYIDPDSCLENFDSYARQIRLSLEGNDPFTMPFANVDQALVAADAYAAKCEKAPMDIAPLPQTVEQAISLDMERERKQAEEPEPSPERIAAFLEGFRGEPEPEPMPTDDLTHQEREIAEFVASSRGREVTEADAELARKTVKAALDARPTEQEQETE